MFQNLQMQTIIWTNCMLLLRLQREFKERGKENEQDKVNSTYN